MTNRINTLFLFVFLFCVMTMTAKNPFFNYKNWGTPYGTYPFDEIENEHYLPAFEEGIKQGLLEIDEIVNNTDSPTFENTIEPYVTSGKLLSVVANCFFNLASAETNDELQKIELVITPKLSEYSSSISLNEKLFARI